MLKANYTALLLERGRKNIQSFQLCAQAGESIFIHASTKECALHFDILSGLYPPYQGDISILGTDLYSLPEGELSLFRRDHIGVIPFCGGLIPEIRMIDQIVLPLKRLGIPAEQLLQKVEKGTSELLPIHSLYNLPGKVSARRQAHAAIVRATINNPSVLILDRALDGFDDIDADVLWQALTDLRKENAILLYFSSDPPPEQITWTQRLYL